MAVRRHPRLVGFFFTILLLGLISLATTDIGKSFLVVMVIVVSVAAGSFYFIFPGSSFFAISLANFLGVYACIFIYLVTTNFAVVQPWAIQVGFVLPIIGFQGGAMLRREHLQYIVQSRRIRDERHLGRTFLWLDSGHADWRADLPRADPRARPKDRRRPVSRGDGDGIGRGLFASGTSRSSCSPPACCSRSSSRALRAFSCRPSPSSPCIRCW